MDHKGGQLDAESLFALARDRGADSRSQLAQMIGDLFCDENNVLGAQEKALMSDILTRVIEEVELDIRAGLAERFAARDDVSAELIEFLANDDIMVAEPILRQSTLLHDGQMIEVIHHKTMQHQLAIAMRARVSEAVSDALVATDRHEVIKQLLENHGAEISSETMTYLVEKSQQETDLRQPLVHREDLPADLAARMYRWVSAALRKHILENFDVNAAVLDEDLDKTVEELIAMVRERARPGQTAVEMAELLAHANAMSPRFLIELLREGQINLFEGLFAEMTGLRPVLVQRFLYETGGETLAAACKAVGINKPDFASIFLLSRQARPGDKVVDPQELPRALEMFDKTDGTEARKLLKRLQQDPEFLRAVKELDGNGSPPAKTG